mmetsp:Transcript_100806/g.159443  ORF Transcript_100806/g.159443 Transcript_100806/m.159443 type:complete len:126 (+) Transcript_100806:69-446(+)
MPDGSKKAKEDSVRLRESHSQLDTDDLDEEERKALAEVSKKGYYHARPKNEEAPTPQRIDPASLPQRIESPPKRVEIDAYQKKWDQFDKHEPVVKEVKKSSSTKSSEGICSRILSVVCCRRKQKK